MKVSHGKASLLIGSSLTTTIKVSLAGSKKLPFSLWIHFLRTNWNYTLPQLWCWRLSERYKMFLVYCGPHWFSHSSRFRTSGYSRVRKLQGWQFDDCPRTPSKGLRSNECILFLLRSWGVAEHNVYCLNNVATLQQHLRWICRSKASNLWNKSDADQLHNQCKNHRQGIQIDMASRVRNGIQNYTWSRKHEWIKAWFICLLRLTPPSIRNTIQTRISNVDT